MHTTKWEMLLAERFHVRDSLLETARTAEAGLGDIFDDIDNTASYNQLRVVAAMQKRRLGAEHFAQTTGYGYNDIGRDALEGVYADVFGTEAALVRPQFISGTHAITTALFACLRPGDELLSVTGRPYDTLLKVIGRESAAVGSLTEQGVLYNEVPLDGDGNPDYAAIKNAISAKTKVAAIQRSKGYAWRRSLTVSEINKLIEFIKGINDDIICFVDNCYGEFADVSEPRADLLAGSLIKNPGGGIAPVGGYVVGREDLVTAAAYRLNVPGTGRDAGPTLGFTAPFLLGFFLAPQTVGGALKGAVFGARMLEILGFPHLPNAADKRSDIVLAASLGSRDAVAAFCLGVQKAAPVDSYVTPEAWEMPGYGCPVIMAAGAFTQGSSLELSADAPMREPYTVFFQGGLSYTHSKLGILMGLNEIIA